jgi:hypothetical protein
MSYVKGGKMTKRTIIRWGLFAGFVLGIWVLPGWSGGGHFDANQHWSAVYHREAFSTRQAEALEYVEATPCEPGMGYHYIKPEEAGAWFEGRSGGLQVLLYDETGFLVGVEYLFTAPSLNAPPVLGMEGPMEGHVPGMPIHYEQHIYFVEPQCPEGEDRE